ncbi:hypothetical protein Ddye_024979 [Dipteronia dyeriana]|uniref:Uncharacterized protein n=1 Tax=Dipteronia dyeriana TaxID=168575 RepID=A0AAD9WU42_9ROSI|nr:hypothetical protein Ddye_024979 [Dipteronia dyeriana]
MLNTDKRANITTKPHHHNETQQTFARFLFLLPQTISNHRRSLKEKSSTVPHHQHRRRTSSLGLSSLMQGFVQMLPEYQVYVKYVDRVVDMDVIEPGECSVISLINDVRRFSVGNISKVGKVGNYALHDPAMLCFNEPVEEKNVEPIEEINVEPTEENYAEPVEANNEEDSEEENVCEDAENDGSEKS